MYWTRNSSTAIAPLFKTFSEDIDLLFKDLLNINSCYEPIQNRKMHYPTDIKYDTKGFHIEMAVVGIDKKDINIEIKDDVLTISYENPADKEYDKNVNDPYIYRGICRKSFKQSYKFGSEYDLTKIDANVDKGLLTIVVPKKIDEVKKSFKVSIK